MHSLQTFTVIAQRLRRAKLFRGDKRLEALLSPDWGSSQLLQLQSIDDQMHFPLTTLCHTTPVTGPYMPICKKALKFMEPRPRKVHRAVRSFSFLRLSVVAVFSALSKAGPTSLGFHE